MNELVFNTPDGPVDFARVKQIAQLFLEKHPLDEVREVALRSPGLFMRPADGEPIDEDNPKFQLYLVDIDKSVWIVGTFPRSALLVPASELLNELLPPDSSRPQG